jgi:hypothetical protein
MFTSPRLLLSTVILLTAPVLLSAAETDVTGVWTGKYEYPAGSMQAPVEFTIIFLQKGDDLTGHVKETNTFGKQPEPFLHSSLKGRLNKETRDLTFTKTYDGTAGASHSVEYSGRIAEDGATVDGGSWKLGGLSGTFLLSKVEGTQAGPLSGYWQGTYYYSQDSGMNPVKFTALLVHEGSGITGQIREVNSFGPRPETWLHAAVSGTYKKDDGAIRFTKTYDGTAGVDHDVEYSARLASGGTSVEDGKWIIGDDISGQFTLEKATAEKAAEKESK